MITSLSAYLTGDLEGYVYDYQGLSLTDASVIVESLNLWTLTDFQGHYSFYDLPIGNYKVVFKYEGLGAAIVDTVAINPLDITFHNSKIHYYDSTEFPFEPLKPKKLKPKVKIVSRGKSIPSIVEREHKNMVVLDPYGDIKGMVRDPFEDPIRYANITVVELGLEMEADYEGSYIIEELEPGLYTFIFSKDGYESRRYIGVSIKKGRATKKNVTLRKRG